MANAIYVNNDGLNNALNGITGYSTSASIGNGYLRLFGNNYTASDSTLIGNLTEVSFPGYSAIHLSSSNWTIAVTSGGTANSAYPTQTFTRSSTGTSATTCYGFYITDTSAAQLYMSSNFQTGGISVLTAGDAISVNLNFSTDSLF